MLQTGVFTGLAESFVGIFKMPKTMVQLAFVQFFSWFALFAMWIYTTPAVTSHVYGTSDTTSALYNEGADWVGICFAIYNGIAAIVAFLLPVIAKLTSRRITHLLALVHWRHWTDFNLFHHRPQYAFGFDDRGWYRLGEYTFNALCNAFQYFTSQQNGLLYGCF